MSEHKIIDDFPQLTSEDIRAAMAYVADREHRVLSPQPLRRETVVGRKYQRPFAEAA